MKSFPLCGCLCLFLLVSLTGASLADSPSGFTIYVQGGESAIISDLNGTSVITIKDVVPYCYINQENTGELIPIQNFSYFSYPLQAALVISGEEKEHISMISVENLSLSDEKKILTLKVRPLEFYEGSGLNVFANNSPEPIMNTGEKVKNTGLYLEIIDPTPTNFFNQCVDMSDMGCAGCMRECSRGGYDQNFCRSNDGCLIYCKWCPGWY